MEQQIVFPISSQDGQTPSQQLSTASTSIEAILKHLQADLLTAQAIEIGRPARYYKAYRACIVDHGIEVLEKLIATCSPDERKDVAELLLHYKNLNQEI